MNNNINANIRVLIKIIKGITKLVKLLLSIKKINRIKKVKIVCEENIVIKLSVK